MGSPRNVHIGPRLGPRMGPSGDDATVAVPQTTLTVGITDSVDPVITAVNFTYAVVVTNTGANTATTVVCVVTLDASLTYVSAVGTGWATGAVGQVVTCTRATLAVGAAPTITVTVTSGGSALTATTLADADADNSPAATQASQTTVVKLVAKDATDGKRYPANSTQWTDFNAYHVAIATPNYPNVAPNAIYGFQEASGNIIDLAAGTFPLVASGTGAVYQQAIAGSTRLALKLVSGASSLFTSTDVALPNIVTTSFMAIIFGLVTPNAVRKDLIGIGIAATPNMIDTEITTDFVRAVSVANVATGSAVSGGRTMPMGTQVDRAHTVSFGFTDVDKLLPTLSGTAAGQQVAIGNYKFGTPNMLVSYGILLFGASAELTAAQIKSLLVALGWTITWT